VPKVVKKGAGSAALKDLKQLALILHKVKSAITIPLTIKIRTGWEKSSRNSSEVAFIAQEEGVTWVGIHGRARSDGYSGLADWDYIADVQAKVNIPILGNGDIHSGEQAVDRLKVSGCAGVMIGRGCLKNPWIFRQAMALFKGKANSVEKDLLWALERLRHHLHVHASEERTVLIQLKKFSSWFSAGYPGSAQFRKNLFASQSLEEIGDRTTEYFQGVQHLMQSDTIHQPFLMGGHG